MAKTQTVTRNAARIVRTRPVTAPSNGVPTSIDTLIAIARTVEPATFMARLATATRNHGVTLAGRNVGRFSGARVTAFQNMTLVRNADWQLNDCQLAFVWRAEFPMAVGRVFIGSVADGVSIVRGVRSDYNRTGHGDPNGKPKTESESYGAKRFDFGPVVAPSRTAPSANATGTAAPVTTPAKRNARKSAA